MKKALRIIGIVLLAVLVAAGVFLFLEKRRTGKDPQVSSGTLEFHKDFPSGYVTPRTVSVWLPEGYRAGEECCVLYMHDGQMLFDSTTTWTLSGKDGFTLPLQGMGRGPLQEPRLRGSRP